MGWTMTVARARCLFKRGLRTPEAVAMAGESEVAVAVAEADAGSTFGIRKKQKTGDDGNTNAHASASAHAAPRLNSWRRAGYTKCEGSPRSSRTRKPWARSGRGRARMTWASIYDVRCMMYDLL